jgi:APA family basic amino acid/polyamine antiporter
MFPRSGGWYVYLREAYGPLWAFLYGWTGLLVMMTGSLAAVAVGFAEYASYFVPQLGTGVVVASVPFVWVDRAGALFEATWTISAGQLLACVSLFVMGSANYIGVRSGNRVQATLTAIKVALITGVPAVALAYSSGVPDLGMHVEAIQRPTAAFGLAMVAVMWAYSGWDWSTFSAGEIIKPSRNIPRALLWGTLLVTALYLTINLSYLVAVPVAELAGVTRVAEHVMQAVVGPSGAALLAGAVVLSTLGCNASGMLGASRVFFAMAEDGVFFAKVASVHPRYHSPHVSVVLTCTASAFLALTGTYEELFTFVTFTALIFNVLGGVAVLVLRRLQPDRDRPYRVWGYPLTPLLFIAGTLILLVNTLAAEPKKSLLGVAIVAAGAPIYLLWRRSRAAASPAS